MRRFIAIWVVCLCIVSGIAEARLLRGSFQAASFTSQWQTLREGGGGQITDIHIDPSDGTTVIRTDTYGAYLYNSSGTCSGWGTTYSGPCWQQLVTSNSIPSPSITTVQLLNYAVAEVVACHSNTNDGYMIWSGTLYVTTNLKNSGGPTWVATTLTTTQGGGDQNNKSRGPWIACDPNNPNVAYISTYAGIYYTTNGLSGGSATFTKDTAVGTGGTGCGDIGCGSIIAFDGTSTFSSGFTRRIMICTWAVGCYITTNGGTAGGGSWTLTSISSATAFQHIICDKFGQFWVVDQTTTVHQYATTSWANQTNNSPAIAIASDPSSSSSATNHLITTQAGGQLSVTSNNGGTWTGDSAQSEGNSTSTAPQPVWLNVVNQETGGVQFLSGNGVALDLSSNVWQATGLGVWTTSAPVTTGQAQTPWAANVIGIEELVNNQVVSPPGNSPLASVWDKGQLLIQNPDAFPSTYYNNSTALNPIMDTPQLDYASAGGTAVGNLTAWQISPQNGATSPASSSDGGNTWTAWANLPSVINVGGAIAASTATNWVVIPGCNSADCGFISGKPLLNYTTNAAASAWATSTISGTPDFVSQRNVRFPLAADRVTAGSFCVVDLSLNFYNSTNNGATFTKVASSTDVDGGGGAGADSLISVPGHAGHYWYTSGSTTGTPSSHLWKNTNSCATGSWTNVDANLKEVFAFGFGAPNPNPTACSGSPCTYPMVYAYGYLNSTTVVEFVQSQDAGATWSAMNIPSNQLDWAGNTLDLLNQMTGDPNVYGRVYVAFRGSAAKYIDTADACPWVNFTNVKPTASLTGTVTLSAQHSGQVPVTSVNFYVDGTLIGTQTSGTGTPTTYSQGWVTGGVATGAHTLKVLATGNNAACTTSLSQGNSFSIPITTH